MTPRGSASSGAALATVASRRAAAPVSGRLEPETQVLLLLAERHRDATAEITGSRRLRDAVGLLHGVTRATPAQIVTMLEGPAPAAGESAVDMLVSRCWALAGDSVVPDRDPTPPTQRSRWQPDHLLVAGLGTAGRPASTSRRDRLRDRIRATLPRHRTVAVVSATGGAGATTITAMLGHVLADHRRDRVVALDVSPNPGPLVARSPGLHSVTVEALLDREEDVLRRFDAGADDVSPPGLDLVTSDGDLVPAPSPAVERAAALLARLYPVVLTDGAGRPAPGTRSVVSAAHQLVVVVAPTIAGVQAGGLLLDRLERRGHGRLATDGVVVVNAVPDHTPVYVAGAVRYFGERVRSVQVVPWDDHLALGADLAPQAVATRTGRAYLDVAADVVDGLAAGAAPASVW